MANKKTNVQRILEKENISYTPHSYDASDGGIDGISVAEKIGADCETVFKTLVAQGASKEYLVFVIPVAHELDLKKCAKAAGEKSVALIPVKDITKVTGYIRGGCSPIGMKKNYRTFFNDSAENFEKVILSAGAIGFQIELKPNDLIKITGGSYASLI